MKFFLPFALIFFLVTCGPAKAASRNDVTGLEWLQMSIAERMEYVAYGMYLLEENGVELSGTAYDYYGGIDRKLKMQPGFYGSRVLDLLAAVASERDPASRPALRRAGLLEEEPSAS